MSTPVSRIGVAPAVRPAAARISAFVRLARPVHWIKNAAVLAPLTFAGSIRDLHLAASALEAAVLLCLASSLVYVFNDIHDADADRLHPVKAVTRPIAAGEVNPGEAWLLFGGIGILLLTLSFHVSALMAGIGAYIALNVAYTIRLKHVAVADLFALAYGFVARVYVGAVAIGAPLSSWMFVTTLCVALFVAATKRQAEIRRGRHDTRAVLAMYSPGFLTRCAEIACISAIVFYALFVIELEPALALTLPVVLFGLLRYRYLVGRGTRGESPVDLLMQDGPLTASVALWASTCIYILART